MVNSPNMSRFRKRVFKLVRMLTFGDDDVHLSTQSSELIRTGIGNHSDREIAYTARHDAVVLQIKSAATSIQRPRHLFNRDVTCGILNAVAARHQHLPLACTNEIALKLFVDRHSTNRHVCFLRAHLDFKRSTGSISHHFPRLVYAQSAITCFASGLCRSRHLNGRAVTLSRARTRLCSFNFTIAWRRSRYQRIEQLYRSLRYLFDRTVESLLVGFRRFCKSAQLPHELNRRRANLFLGRRRFEVMKCFDISTHAVLLLPALEKLVYVTNPRNALSRMPPPQQKPRLRRQSQ